MILKSTNQGVFEIPWTAAAKRPWPSDYRRVFRPFLPGEGTRTGNRGEVMIVHKSKLDGEDVAQ